MWEVLQRWSRQTKAGVANVAPGIIFADDDDLEYWIVDWQEHSVEVYRREEAVLKHISTLYENDILQSPHLTGFQCEVSEIFVDVL